MTGKRNAHCAHSNNLNGHTLEGQPAQVYSMPHPAGQLIIRICSDEAPRNHLTLLGFGLIAHIGMTDFPACMSVMFVNISVLVGYVEQPVHP